MNTWKDDLKESLNIGASNGYCFSDLKSLYNKKGWVNGSQVLAVNYILDSYGKNPTGEINVCGQLIKSDGNIFEYSNIHTLDESGIVSIRSSNEANYTYSFDFTKLDKSSYSQIEFMLSLFSPDIDYLVVLWDVNRDKFAIALFEGGI